MKPSDYISVGMIAIVGTILAYFLLNSILGDPAEQTTSFEYIRTVSSSVGNPSSDTFNAMALNPTVEVYIGSCTDLDNDGSLSQEELDACGEADPVSNLYSNSYSSESGLSEEENIEQNRANGLADGTSEEQRNAVQNDIDARIEEVNSRNAASETVDSSARRETTSTGN